MNLSTWDCEKRVLSALAQQSPGDILELGAWAGATTAVLAENTPHKVVAIDAWHTNLPGHQRSFEQAQEQFAAVLAAFPNVECFRQYTVPPPKELADRRFGLIFVDAGHESPECLSDMGYYWPYLMPGGHMVVHDVFDHNWCKSIIPALWGFHRSAEDYGWKFKTSFVFPTPPEAERAARGIDYMGGLAIFEKEA